MNAKVKEFFRRQPNPTAADAADSGVDGNTSLHQHAEKAATNKVESEFVDWSKLIASGVDLGPLRNKSAEALAKAVRKLKRIPS